MGLGTPLAVCSVVAVLQFALNYFRALTPEIENIVHSDALKRHPTYPEYSWSIDMLIRSAKEELAEFDYHERQRRSWGESS